MNMDINTWFNNLPLDEQAIALAKLARIVGRIEAERQQRAATEELRQQLDGAITADTARLFGRGRAGTTLISQN